MSGIPRGYSYWCYVFSFFKGYDVYVLNYSFDYISIVVMFKYKIYLVNKIIMAHTIELGTISSRGQIAIPTSMRKQLDLKDGEKVLFLAEGDSIIIKKVSAKKTWEEVTRPLREAVKESGFKEEDVVDLIHRIRKKKHEAHVGH